MKVKGKELIFISWVKRDESGVQKVSDELIETMQEDNFNIHSLSISENTLIACGFNSFVVKLKNVKDYI